MTFEVWAPRADSVALQLDGVGYPMTERDGWWSANVDWRPDADYGYLLDGESVPVPDPRSRRQPSGVHGLSRTYAPVHPAAWPGRELAGGVIYELHVGTFTPAGTLDSAIERLGHLVDLGIDFVELLPVNGFNGTHNWGYDGVLWYTVHEGYGGPAAYQRFVDACHSRGLGVIQDVVYNHLGPSGNYLPRFAPYFVEGHSNTWGDTIDLAAPEVREYIIGNALLWLQDYGVDGLRLDAVHALVDDSPKHLLQELAERTDPAILIAESDLNDPRLITPRPEGYGLTAQWSDDYHHAAHVNLSGETTGYYGDFNSLAALGKVMTKGFFHDGTYSSFRERNHGVPIDLGTMPTWRLVTFTQDHDQIGNRAVGDRLSATLDDDLLAIEAVLTLLGPFTPMIFMGEEWGASTPWQFFTSHPEPELGRATAEGRIAEFAKMGWDAASVPDPQDPATFDRSKLDWAELSDPRHGRLFGLYRRLVRLRRELPGLTDPRFSTIAAEWDEEKCWFRLDRPGASVVINFSDTERCVPVTLGEVALATGEARIEEGLLRLSPASAAVLRA
ncbi:MAG: Malto-oligosyltrehalose trehalohydrolase [Rhodoglobus sp.]|nr:Malto-oligosyltrehalose trehalohydrolase [Rhodoglobus sp.]